MMFASSIAYLVGNAIGCMEFKCDHESCRAIALRLIGEMRSRFLLRSCRISEA